MNEKINEGSTRTVFFNLHITTTKTIKENPHEIKGDWIRISLRTCRRHHRCNFIPTTPRACEHRHLGESTLIATLKFRQRTSHTPHPMTRNLNGRRNKYTNVHTYSRLYNTTHNIVIFSSASLNFAQNAHARMECEFFLGRNFITSTQISFTRAREKLNSSVIVNFNLYFLKKNDLRPILNQLNQLKLLKTTPLNP